MFDSVSDCFCGCLHVSIFVLLPPFLFLRCCFCLFLILFVFISVCFVSVSAPGNHRWESYLFFRFPRSRREAPPTAEGGGFQGPPWGPGPWGVLLYTLLLNIKLAFGAFDLNNRIGTGIFHARLGKIKVDGNNPQG